MPTVRTRTLRVHGARTWTVVAAAPVDVELFALSLGGVMAPRADWTAAATRHLENALRKKLAESGVRPASMASDVAEKHDELLAHERRADAGDRGPSLAGSERPESTAEQGRPARLDVRRRDPPLRQATGTDYMRVSWIAELGTGRPARSLAMIERLLRTEPDEPVLPHLRADTWRRCAGGGDARRAFEASRRITVRPDADVPSFRSPGRLAMKVDAPAVARAALSTYMDRTPDAPDRTFRVRPAARAAGRGDRREREGSLMHGA